jgi:hypothetical protein
LFWGSKSRKGRPQKEKRQQAAAMQVEFSTRTIIARDNEKSNGILQSERLSLRVIEALFGRDGTTNWRGNVADSIPSTKKGKATTEDL